MLRPSFTIMRFLKSVSVLVCLSFFTTGVFGENHPIQIRVAILEGADSVTVAISGPYQVLDLKTHEGLYSGRNLPRSRVTSDEDGIFMRGLVFRSEGIVLKPSQRAGAVVNKRRYRGTVTLKKMEGDRLLVINTLELEPYLKGVLFHEISPAWPLEAIKAQAVASRTYAMYQIRMRTSKDYDVKDDVSSQVYGGFFSEKRKTNRAVNFTDSEVLLYEDKIFPAYFHATCGGMTEDASELWKIDIPPLDGGRVCRFCTDSPHYFWKVSLSLGDLQNKLNLPAGMGALENILIKERNISGRVRELEFVDQDGHVQNLSSKVFRTRVGPDQIRSTHFSIEIEKRRVIFSGKGWGHGVGMCQWGALGMALKGYDYKEILGFYYPQSHLVKRKVL